MADLTIKERVASVEAHQEDIQKDVHEMRTNHLPHIEQKVDSLSKWIMGALFSAILALLGIGANIVIQLLIH
jgi:hypothetical protein